MISCSWIRCPEPSIIIPEIDHKGLREMESCKGGEAVGVGVLDNKKLPAAVRLGIYDPCETMVPVQEHPVFIPGL